MVPHQTEIISMGLIMSHTDYLGNLRLICDQFVKFAKVSTRYTIEVKCFAIQFKIILQSAFEFIIAICPCLAADECIVVDV